MKTLLLTHSFNSLTQRLFVELREQGHEVSVEFDINDAVTEQAVELFQPDLIIAPFLKRAIPEIIWKKHCCLIVHPGIVGDRGPSALDWAILNGESHWGVTVLQANAEMDAGDIWASAEFPMRSASKSSLYRNEVADAALQSVMLAVDCYQAGDFKPSPLDPDAAITRGRLRPLARQEDRAIDWQQDDTETVLRKIRSADGFPGVKDQLLEREVCLYDARNESKLRGEPGELIARCGPAVCRATTDGAVWLGHLRDKHSVHPFKLPATQVLGDAIGHLPLILADEHSGYRDIWYEERDAIGYLHFAFYNGAMGTEQCSRLLAAYREACERPTRMILLMGGPDYWSNGMHLNLIEATESAADESWRNINAIDDLAREIIETEGQLTVSVLQGNAGAGGVFLARAADRVWARSGVILNPHYKDMGNLFGSEYWTYLLPRYAGVENARRITQARLPMGVKEAQELGLVDEAFGLGHQDFLQDVEERAQALLTESRFDAVLQENRERRQRDEAEKPLQSYRDEELQRMRMNFYGFDPSYHVARYNFIHKVPKSRTPLTIATHRRTGRQTRKAS